MWLNMPVLESYAVPHTSATSLRISFTVIQQQRPVLKRVPVSYNVTMFAITLRARDYIAP